MGTAQIVFTAAFILLLGGLGGWFAWRQVRTLRRLRQDATTPQDEVQYLRPMARRRLVSSVLLIVMAAQLGGSFFFEGTMEDMANEIKAATDSGQQSGPREDQKPMIRFSILYWITFLLVLFGVLVLAFWDLMAIRRFGQRAFAKLQADRRAMIEREADRLRGQRNGHPRS